MRILMLNYNVAFVGGGAFYRSWHFGRHLAQRGHAVTVVATSRHARASIEQRPAQGLELVEMPSLLPPRWRYGYDPYEVVRRLAWVLRRRFDIVHALESRPVVIYPALLARLRGARLVLDWCDWFGRGGSVEQRPNPFLRAVLRPLETFHEEAFRPLADATVVVNAALQARAESLGVSAHTILRLVNGANPDGLRPLDQAECRASLHVAPDQPLLGYLGSLFPADAALLAQAFDQVRAVYPRAHLVLIGHPKSAIPAGPGVWRVGFVDYATLNRYLAACDVMCLPLADTVANRGRWPSKMMDYFAAGRPTVACDVGGVGDVLRETQAGLAAPPTATGLAEQVLQLLGSPALAAALGQNARHAAETDYSMAALTTRLEQMYLGLLGSAARPVVT